GEAQTFVNKTLQYEKTPAGGYENRWLLFAEVLFPQPYNGGAIDLDGGMLAEDLLHFTDENPGLTVKRMYENNTDPAYRPGTGPVLPAGIFPPVLRGQRGRGGRAAGAPEAAVRGVRVLRRREPLDADDAAHARRSRAAHVQRQLAHAVGERTFVRGPRRLGGQ